MENPNWEKQFSKVSITTHAIYGSALGLIGVVFFLMPPRPDQWDPSLHQMVFIATMSMAVLTLAASRWMYSQLLSLYSLEMRAKGIGFPAAIESFRSGIVLSACLGDLCATLGVAFYVITREPNRLWLFMGLWGIHYVLATIWLRKGREDLELLAGRHRVAAEPMQSAG